MSPVFEPGDLALLVDSRGRRFLLTLDPEGVFHFHAGMVTHKAIIGQEEGTQVTSSGGTRLVAVRPTLAEYILKMRRGAQVIYPKDIGTILVAADVLPGARVVEAGIGSGALTMALLRAVGPTGSVTSYEIREDFAERARQNIAVFMGDTPNLVIRLADVYDGIVETEVDRVLLDLPEPWRAAKHAATALHPGGILLTYLPTVPQVQQAVEAMRDAGFGFIETLEVLHRTWNIQGQSVRPDHRMVAHTGFLTVGRLLSP